MNWLKYRDYLIVTGVILFLPFMAQGQTRMNTVTVNGRVSEKVALALSPTSSEDNLRVESRTDVNGLTFTLAGSGPDVLTARVSILIRSNSSYKITGLVQSKAAMLANFAVIDVRPTGRFAASDAIEYLNVARELDSRATTGKIRSVAFPLGLSSPLAILNGPRVSLAGTINSSDNALEVTFMITVRPDADADTWHLYLTLSGAVSET